MHFINKPWTIQKIVEQRATIDEKPPYQRGPVWGLSQQQLLIDSIINRFDIPKIYLRHMNGASMFDYEVADGKQRLRAIWEFVAGEYALAIVQRQDKSWHGKTFDDLKSNQKRHILSYKLIVATVHSATNDDVRELFARLQNGERLTPPELRNSIASALGDVVRAMALTHPVFAGSPFPTARYKRDDLLAHVFALEHYSGTCDLKAPDLAKMYKDNAKALDQKIVKRVNAHLAILTKVQASIPGGIKTKWGFCDLFWIISRNQGQLPAPDVLGGKFVNFERKRLRHSKEPSKLVDASNPNPDHNLYDYIMAFSVGGALKENVSTRYRVLKQELL